MSTSIFALPFHLKGIAQGADRDARATGSTLQRLLQGRAARAPRARARARVRVPGSHARVWLNAAAAKSRPHSFKDEGFRETTTLSFLRVTANTVSGPSNLACSSITMLPVSHPIWGECLTPCAPFVFKRPVCWNRLGHVKKQARLLTCLSTTNLKSCERVAYCISAQGWVGG